MGMFLQLVQMVLPCFRTQRSVSGCGARSCPQDVSEFAPVIRVDGSGGRVPDWHSVRPACIRSWPSPGTTYSEFPLRPKPVEIDQVLCFSPARNVSSAAPAGPVRLFSTSIWAESSSLASTSCRVRHALPAQVSGLLELLGSCACVRRCPRKGYRQDRVLFPGAEDGHGIDADPAVLAL